MDKKLVANLVILVEHHPIIWDPQRRDNKDKDGRERAWEDMANSLYGNRWIHYDRLKRDKKNFRTVDSLDQDEDSSLDETELSSPQANSPQPTTPEPSSPQEQMTLQQTDSPTPGRGRPTRGCGSRGRGNASGDTIGTEMIRFLQSRREDTLEEVMLKGLAPHLSEVPKHLHLRYMHVLNAVTQIFQNDPDPYELEEAVEQL